MHMRLLNRYYASQLKIEVVEHCSWMVSLGLTVWRWSTLKRTREPYPLVRDFVSYVWTMRSLEILGCNVIFLPHITDIERRFAVTSMSNVKMNLPDKADAMQRLRDDLSKKRATKAKKVQASDMSKEDAPAAPEHIYTSSPKQNLVRKRQRKDSTNDPGKKVDSSTKKKAAELHLHDMYKLVSDKCAKFRKANDVLKADKAKVDISLKELEQKVVALEGDLKGVEDERNRYREESSKAKADVVEQERLVVALKEQLKSITFAAICKARADIFREYMASKHINWNHEEMQEVIDTCEEMLRFEGSSPGEEAGDKEATKGNVDKSLDDPTSLDDDVVDPPTN
ncbi:hypothetical protein LWI29_007334 [Acer saccharum]|uniref:Uncharacterized protein n=1 Tax=Acer saccharum TaxID=4024 RepID=A0AA39RYV9_ACESA|nr:hypothetical protein LWI29_007334 [Acer saccharum]